MEYITERNRIYLLHEGMEVAEITFPHTADGVYTINHTYVDNRLRGQGIASNWCAGPWPKSSIAAGR